MRPFRKTSEWCTTLLVAGVHWQPTTEKQEQGTELFFLNIIQGSTFEITPSMRRVLIGIVEGFFPGRFHFSGEANPSLFAVDCFHDRLQLCQLRVFGFHRYVPDPINTAVEFACHGARYVQRRPNLKLGRSEGRPFLGVEGDAIDPWKALGRGKVLPFPGAAVADIQGQCNLAVWLHADTAPWLRVLPFDGTRFHWAKGFYGPIDVVDEFLDPYFEVLFAQVH